MSKIKRRAFEVNHPMTWTKGEGCGLPKVRVRCAKCKSIIDTADKECPKCKCVVFY